MNTSWNETYAILEALTSIPKPNRVRVEEVLDCEFLVVEESPQRSWYVCRFNRGPVFEAELRYGSKGGIIILELNPASDREGMLENVLSLGEPLDIDFPTDDGHPEVSFCYKINDRRVWFTKKKVAGADILASIAIHF